MSFDPLRTLQVLQDHEVRYVLIGGLAGQVRGAPLTTQDIDVCYERSPDNLARLAAALVALNARLRVAHVDEDLPFILDARTLAAGDSFTFTTDAGDVDVLGTPLGTRGYDDLVQGAEEFDLGEGLRVKVVSIDDLIRMKEHAGRGKDRVHLEVLAALQEELDRPDE